MKTETPLHHQPSVMHMEAGAPFLLPGSWGDFISNVLTARQTIHARRAARQRVGCENGEAMVIASDTSTKNA